MPLRVFAKPNETAAPYLAPDGASFVTGTAFSIDGEVTAGETHTYWRSA